jgi:hypothetical protein
MTNTSEQEQRAKILVEQSDRLLGILGVDVSNVPIRDPAHTAWSGRPSAFRLAADAYDKLAEADKKTNDRVLWELMKRLWALLEEVKRG